MNLSRLSFVTLCQKAGEQPFEMTVADDEVEDALLRNEVTLIFDHEGSRLPHLDGVTDFGITFILDD